MTLKSATIWSLIFLLTGPVTRAQDTTGSLPDLALQPAKVITEPGPGHVKSSRGAQGVPAIERAANGRLWASWVRQQLKQENRKIPPNHSWIAALALEHSQSILTRDGDFGHVKDIVTVGW